MDSGGGNVWLRFISLRSSLDRAKTRQDVGSQPLFAFLSCIRRTSNQVFSPFAEPWRCFPAGKDGAEVGAGDTGERLGCSPTAWGGGLEDLSFSSQHPSVYTQQEFGEVRRRGPDS